MQRKYTDYIFRSYRKRKAHNALMHVLLILASVVAIVPLFSVFFYVLSQGAPALSHAFFTELPKPVGETGGGMANSIWVP